MIDYNAKAQTSRLKELFDDLEFSIRTPYDVVTRIRTRDYCEARLADFNSLTFEDVANIAITFSDGYQTALKDVLKHEQENHELIDVGLRQPNIIKNN